MTQIGSSEADRNLPGGDRLAELRDLAYMVGAEVLDLCNNGEWVLGLRTPPGSGIDKDIIRGLIVDSVTNALATFAQGETRPLNVTLADMQRMVDGNEDK